MKLPTPLIVPIDIIVHRPIEFLTLSIWVSYPLQPQSFWALPARMCEKFSSFLSRGFSALVESPHKGNPHQHVMRSIFHISQECWQSRVESSDPHVELCHIGHIHEGSSERSFVQRGEGSRGAL